MRLRIGPAQCAVRPACLQPAAHVTAVLFWNNPFGNSCQKGAERHFLSCWLARLPNTSGMVLPEPTTDAVCRKIERVLLEADRRGRLVVLGRAAAIVLCGRPGAVHVRLDGPEEALVFQAMQIDQIDEDEARRRQRNSDRARMDRVKHLYQADPRDPRHYHLVLKSTALARDLRRADRCRGPGAGGRARRAQLRRRPPSSPGPPSTAPAAHV